ncbi:glycosyltransferase 61 family protein, partial [Roseovarius gaetbuli]|uniref:glycosyltransferase 61 family protein n=1 Tax=Roseovarius gaetbuli TaxID=1356575 RepID=UPI001481F673
MIPDFVSNTLQQATHLVARPESEPLLRAAFSDSTQVQVAHLPTAADPALARRLDRWIDAQEQLESRSGRMSLRTRLSGLGHRLRKSGRVLKDMVTTSGPVTASFGDLTELPPPVIAEFADHLIACLEAGVERHVHFGPTARRVERMVAAQLLAAGLKADSILFIGQKISIKDALAKHKVDLVLAGFAQIPPVGMIDVVAAGVPLALREEPSGVYSSDIPTAVWTEAQDVVDLISSGETATAQAAMQWYQTHATRAVFERLWNAIVTATEGPMRDDLTPEQIRAATIRLFDAEWYLTHNPDVKNAGRDPLEHYLADGEREGCAPCALFHPRHYAATLGRNDCPKTGLLAHYLTYGEARGHSPHPLFAPRQMQQSLSFEAGLAAASTDETVLEKYMTSYGTDVVPHPLFDPVHYARGLAVPPANQPLLLHFLETGAYDGLSPHPLIEAQMLATWGDKPLEALFEWAGRPAASPSEPSPAVLFDPVHFCGSDHARYANAAPNLLWAYLIEGNRRTRGPHLLVEPAHVARRRPDVLTHNRRPVLLDMAQGRMDGIDTHPLVSVSHILEQAPWVGQSGEHPTRYFVTRAADENLNSHPYFSTQVYLLKNPDVAEAGLNPLVHYLTYGQYEGRLPHLFFDGNDYYARYLRDKGGDSPLLHYVRHGAGDYLPILPHDGAHHSMGLKTARAMFLAQTDAGQAEAILKATIHPDWGAPHPTLEVRSLPRAPERDKTVKATTVYPARQVTLSRPAVMAGAYIAPPSVAYTAPSVTVGCWPGTTVIGGNDGFVTGAGAWHAEGPECGPLPDTAQAQDSDLELRGQTSVVARRKDAVLLRHFHHEQAVARAIMACGSRSHLFDHFMLEVLPRVMCAARVAPVGTPVLIEDDLPRLHHQALRLAVPDHPILQVARGSQIKVAQLYAASMGTHLGSPRKAPGGPAQPGPAAVLMHPALIDLLGQLADQAGAPEADLPVAQKTAARLFLYTQDPAYRALLNFEEIADALGDRGFAMRDFDALSFTRLARYIAQADEIVITDGPHIAALAFARPDARIYVLLSNAPGTDFHRADIIGRLRGAQVVSFAGWQHQGSGGFKPEDAHFNLPVEHVKPFFGQTVLPTTQQPLDK